HEEFHELFVGARSPEEVLERIRRREPVKDQWQAQILARVLAGARVVVVTGMSHSVVEDMLMTPASSVEEALEEAARLAGCDLRSARVVAVPEGPYVIPELAG
ncbi:MAG: lactate racemization operon protein LarA, partial [Thermoprotei archaeon]